MVDRKVKESVEMVDRSIEELKKAKASLLKKGSWEWQHHLINARDLARRAEANLTVWNPCGPI